MMMGNFSEQFVLDFAERTFHNLKTYCEHCKKTATGDKDKAVSFEITQMINSFLGGLVFPKEKCSSDELYVKKLKEKFPNEEIKRIYEDDRKLRMVSQDHAHFFGMIKNIRNAVAHGHIIPFPNNEVVAGFRFQNIDEGFITAEYELTNNHIFNILMYVLSVMPNPNNKFEKAEAEDLAKTLSEISRCQIELDIGGVAP